MAGGGGADSGHSGHALCFTAACAPPPPPSHTPVQVLDVMPQTSYWLRSPKPITRMLALQPGDLSLLAAMPALRLLCMPLGDLWRREETTPQRLQLEATQWGLAMSFCTLLPGLLVLSSHTSQSARLFRGGDPARGVDAALLREVKAQLQDAWQAEGAALQQAALGLLRREAAQGQLSQRAAELLAAQPWGAQPSAVQGVDAQPVAV